MSISKFLIPKCNPLRAYILYCIFWLGNLFVYESQKLICLPFNMMKIGFAIYLIGNFPFKVTRRNKEIMEV